MCRGPHLPNTGCVKKFWLNKNSAAYWLGKQQNDSLQRVYGIAFPNKDLMAAHKKMIEEASKRDHRTIGMNQELYFSNAEFSPGSSFFTPHGTRLYHRIIEVLRNEYRVRNFQEVITPNIYNKSKPVFSFSLVTN